MFVVVPPSSAAAVAAMVNEVKLSKYQDNSNLATVSTDPTSRPLRARCASPDILCVTSLSYSLLEFRDTPDAHFRLLGELNRSVQESGV